MDQVARTITYFDNTFEEAMALIREARDYLAFQEKADLSKLTPVGRMDSQLTAITMR